jgi:hypothetical protein
MAQISITDGSEFLSDAAGTGSRAAPKKIILRRNRHSNEASDGVGDPRRCFMLDSSAFSLSNAKMLFLLTFR